MYPAEDEKVYYVKALLSTGNSPYLWGEKECNQQGARITIQYENSRRIQA